MVYGNFNYYENERYATKLYTEVMQNRQALTLVLLTPLPFRYGLLLPFSNVPGRYESLNLSSLL